MAGRARKVQRARPQRRSQGEGRAGREPRRPEAAIHAVRTLGRYPIAADLAQVRVDVPKFEPFDQWLKGRPEAETILRARK